MNICCLLGSPRKNGNTAEVLKREIEIKEKIRNFL
jgi:multimeric flavodoxin WrbA